MSNPNDQIPFDASSPFNAAEFVDNPEPRCPCILLVDTSGSMSGARIQSLNAGLVAFKQELLADELAAKRVEVAIIGFGPVKTIVDFVTPELFEPPTLVAATDTPMGAAIERAIDLLEERKKIYRDAGIAYYRPWIFLLTDGEPTDSWSAAASRVHSGEAKNQFSFFAVGVEDANLETLGKIGTRSPLKLKGLSFRELFSWLSRSLKSVSRSRVGDQVAMESPVAPNGWATVG